MPCVLVRRLRSACVLPAVAAVALVAPVVPAVANASGLGEQCSGSNILGRGASVQKIAQELWIPLFNTSTNRMACNGTQGSKGTPTVSYESTGSGAGMEAWGLNGHAFEAGKVAFVATDEPPDSAQREEIESHRKAPGAEELQTIPVLQTAVAVLIHLPKFCAAASTGAPGRLALDNTTLEEIWGGKITKWSEITEAGDKLYPKGGACDKNAGIARVVRLDESGTTWIFKKYLGLINPAKNIIGEMGWTELATGKPFNQEWPGAVVRPAGEGAQALLEKVASTESSIGYADLADARRNGDFDPPVGGDGTTRFWAKIQNNGLTKTSPIYTDPSTSNGDSATVADANCESTEYTNGGALFPPESVADLWNEVSTKTRELHYTICGLSYDLSFHEYAKFPGTTLGEASTVNNYLFFATGSGEEYLNNHRDYLGLPNSLTKIAKLGAAKTRF